MFCNRSRISAGTAFLSSSGQQSWRQFHQSGSVAARHQLLTGGHR
jgi:hypothetical protein